MTTPHEAEIREAMEQMIKDGYLERWINEDGEEHVRITPSGLDYFARLQEASSD